MQVVLRTEGLVKRFGGLLATDHVNFELREGEIKGLIGPNGAGKTTFFNLLTGVFLPDSGKVFYLGEDITGMTSDKICRKGLVRTYQITSVFPKLSVFENVRLSAHIGFQGTVSAVKGALSFQEVVEKVDHILELTGMVEFRNKIAGEISQGDQRLLEVAIALGSNPKVLLLDEPTAGLSAKETGDLADRIRDLFEKKVFRSVVLIEHDLEVLINLAHTICVLNYGEVIKDGTTDEVCNDTKVQEVYLAGGKVNA